MQLIAKELTDRALAALPFRTRSSRALLLCTFVLW